MPDQDILTQLDDVAMLRKIDRFLETGGVGRPRIVLRLAGAVGKIGRRKHPNGLRKRGGARRQERAGKSSELVGLSSAELRRSLHLSPQCVCAEEFV